MRISTLIGDYSLTQKFMVPVALLAIFGNIIFHFLEQSYGYWESFPIRVGIIVFCIPILFFKHNKIPNWLRIAYWETALFLALPFVHVYFALQNGMNEYWQSSLYAAAFLLGICSQPLFLPFHYLGGVALATFLYYLDPAYSEKVLQTSFKIHPIVFFLMIISGLVKWYMEKTHQIALHVKEAERKADEERLMRESAEDREKILHSNMIQLQGALDEIKKREECILRFVSPTIVEELRSGKNPLNFQPEMREMAVMFCDIREFTQLTEKQSFIGKFEYLNAYFSKMTTPMVTNKGVVDKIMGDALMGIFPNGATAIKAAIEMRLALHEYNREMLKGGRSKIRNGIGISKGVVTYGNFGSIDKLDRTVIGETVNIASRLESKTKMYSVEIVVTEEIINDLKGACHYRWIDNVQVKGSTRHLKLFEIYDHQPAEVVAFKDATRDIMEKALTIYFQKSFHGALRLFLSLKERVPPHLYLEDEVMDSLIDYYIQRCRQWISTPNAWELIEKWDGFHVFQEK